MAKYVNKENVDFHCPYHEDCPYHDMGLSSDCLKCSEYVIDYQEFMQIPTADVIERSKINKAIEEIKKLPDEYCDNYASGAIADVLCILEENIGE